MQENIPTTKRNQFEAQKPIMNRKEAAEFLCISVGTLDNEVDNGLPYITIQAKSSGRPLKRFRRDLILAYYEEKSEMAK